MKTKCLYCNRLNAAGREICASCGAPLAEVVKHLRPGDDLEIVMANRGNLGQSVNCQRAYRVEFQKRRAAPDLDAELYAGWVESSSNKWKAWSRLFD